MNRDRRRLRSIGETIVALGDAAGCLLTVSCDSLAAVLAPGRVCVLAADDVRRRGSAAIAEFSRSVGTSDFSRGHLHTASVLFAHLITLCSNGARFDGAGKTDAEIQEHFQNKPTNPPPK